MSVGCAIAIVIAVGRLLALRWSTLPFDWLLWSDRDVVRAASLAVDRPTLGAEVSYGQGARIPGGFLYELWGLALAFEPDVASVYRLQVGLEALALLVLGVLVGRRRGAWAGALAAAVAVCAMPWTSTTSALWNPGFVPLFAVAALAGADRVASSGSPAGVAAIVLAGALGAQLHLSVALVALVLLGVVSALQPRVTLAGLPLASALLAGAFLPYLVHDAALGFPNSRALHDAPRGAPGDGDLVGASRWFRLDVDFADGLAAHGQALLLGVGLAVIALLIAARRRDTATLRSVLPSVGVVVVTVVLLARSDTGTAAYRYALATVPALALLVAEGWASLALAIAARARPLASVLIVALAAFAVVVVGAEARAVELRGGEPTRWANLRRMIDDVRADTGWSLREAAGRTAIWEQQRDVWTREARRGITWLLLRDGTTFPGSLPSPCALVLVAGAELSIDDAWLAARLPPSLGAPHVRATRRSGPIDRVVVYDLDGGICPTSLSQRYLETHAEADVRALWKVGPPNVTVPVPGQPTRHVGRLVVDDLPAIGVAVDLVASSGHVEATLHASQLRGRAYNTELLEDAWVVAPRLVLRGPAGDATLGFAPGLVGDGAALTPLRAAADVPAGTYAVDLVTDVVTARVRPGEPLPSTVAARLRVVDALVVSGGAR